MPYTLFYKLFVLMSIIGIAICTDKPTTSYFLFFVKPCKIKPEINSHSFKLTILIAAIRQSGFEHLSEFGISLKYLTYLVIHLKSADHSFSSTVLFGQITVIQFFCYCPVQLIFIDVVFIRIHQPQVRTDIIGILIMLLPSAVIVFVSQFLSGIHKLGHPV